MPSDVFILGGKRTPMGEYVGALKDTGDRPRRDRGARGAGDNRRGAERNRSHDYRQRAANLW